MRKLIAALVFAVSLVAASVAPAGAMTYAGTGIALRSCASTTCSANGYGSYPQQVTVYYTASGEYLCRVVPARGPGELCAYGWVVHQNQATGIGGATWIYYLMF